MCLAIFKPKFSEFPSLEILARAWENNPHGAGLAIVENGAVTILKGLMTFESLESVLKDVSLNEFDVVLHFRWSTSGTVIPELTHPFPVSRKNDDLKALHCVTDKAVIHNGVMFNPKINDYSDTAIFSRYMAHAAPSNEVIQTIIGEDRLAIVTGSGVQTMGQWSIIDGCYYSNTYSIAPARSYHKRPKAESWAFDDNRRESENDPFFFQDNYGIDYSDLEYCPNCDSDDVEMIGVNTDTCECLDCGTIFNETEFLMPKNPTRYTKKGA